MKANNIDVKQNEQILSFSEYIESEKKKIRDKLALEEAKKRKPHIPCTIWKQWEKEMAEYAKSDEIQAVIPQLLIGNVRYEKLSNEKVALDPDLIAEYAAYAEERQKEVFIRSVKSQIKDFAKYLKKNKELYAGLAEYLLEIAIDYIRQVFREEEIFASYYSFEEENVVTEPLDADNYDDFLDCLDDQVEMAAENFLSDDTELGKLILFFYKGNDPDQYQIELDKIREKATCFNIDWLAEEIGGNIGKYGLSAAVAKIHRLYYEERDAFDDIEDLISENPYYQESVAEKIRKQQEEEMIRLRIEQNILERIPENPIDLYPLARKMNRKFVLHIGPTNSGKTHDALDALKKAKSGVYLAPLRLLAYECYERLNADGVPCSMVTGEEERIVQNAKHTASTVELLNVIEHYDVAVIDEAQMITDMQRGSGWTAAILGCCADEIHVCAAPEAEELLVRLITMCGDLYEIHRHKRSVPLTPDKEAFVFPKSVQKKDALIVFSKAKVLAVAAELQRKGIKCSVIYGNLPYEARQNEVRKFIEGKTDVVVATDAIGMGMNMPCKRIVFLELKKFDGISERELNPAEVRQIAGRAGRKGMFDIGTYTCSYSIKRVRKIYDKEPENADFAVLGFSRNLVDIEGKLSDIICRWKENPDKPDFKKQDMTVEKKLCLELEQHTEDKNLIYSFMTIPFDTKSEELHSVWFAAFKAEKDGKHLKFTMPMYDNYDLDELESAYKYCDLMYFYNRRFCDRNDLDRIMEVKKNIAGLITDLLSKQSLKGRRCRNCGKNLSWDYPYPMCQKCHDRMYPKRHGYYDYYEDEDEDWY